jgi:hypothetical protein
VIESADDFPQVRELWEEVFASCARATRAGTPASTQTLFQSYAWNEITARVFAERERPYVVVAESDSGAAIIPACVRRDSVSLLGEELFDYRDVIAASDAKVLDAAWEKLFELQKPIEVKAVRGERAWAEMKPFAGAPYLPSSVPLERNKSLERNLGLLEKSGCAFRSGNRLAALAEALPLDCASPAAMAPLGVTNGSKPLAKMSQGILRSAQDHKQSCGQDDRTSGDRVNGRSGDRMQIPRRYAPRNDKSIICDLVRRMYELKAMQESGSLFRDPLRIAAVVQMAASAVTEVFTIEREGELVAAVLTFIDGDVCRFYGTYYDARWARYSPGVSLLYHVIQQAQARGLDFDLMTGEQPYKMRFASEVVPLYIARVPVTARLAA